MQLQLGVVARKRAQIAGQLAPPPRVLPVVHRLESLEVGALPWMTIVESTSPCILRVRSDVRHLHHYLKRGQPEQSPSPSPSASASASNRGQARTFSLHSREGEKRCWRLRVPSPEEICQSKYLLDLINTVRVKILCHP